MQMTIVNRVKRNFGMFGKRGVFFGTWGGSHWWLRFEEFSSLMAVIKMSANQLKSITTVGVVLRLQILATINFAGFAILIKALINYAIY